MAHPRTLGIDLGTERLFAALTRADGAPIALDIGAAGEAELYAHTALVDDPDESQVLVGYPLTRPYALFGAERIAFALLRLVGRTYAAVEREAWAQHLPFELVANERGDVIVQLRGRAFSPEQLLATLLTQVGALARDAGCKEPVEAAVALPVALSDAQRRAVVRAAQLAGFGGLSFVHAPEAAALELTRRHPLPVGHTLIVLDWGAGSLDGAVLTQQDERLALRSVAGDSTLGALDLDAALVAAHIAQLCAAGYEQLVHTPLCRARLHHAWSRARARMGEADETMVHLPHLGAAAQGTLDGSTALSRALLDEHAEPLWHRAEALVRRLVEAAEVAQDAPVSIVVLGGMGQSPAVHNRLQKLAAKAWRQAGGAKAVPWAKLIKQQQAQMQRAEPVEAQADAGNEANEANEASEALVTPDSPPQPATPAIAEPDEEDARPPAFTALGAALFAQRMADQKAPLPVSRLGAELQLIPSATQDSQDAAGPSILVAHNTALPHSHTLTLAQGQTTLNLCQSAAWPHDASSSGEAPCSWLGEARIHGVAGRGACATLHLDTDGLMELEAHDAKGHALEVAWLARPGLSQDELMALARAAWVAQQRRQERAALVAAEERASALCTTAQRQLELYSEDQAAVIEPLTSALAGLQEVLAQPLDLQQTELFERERSDGEAQMDALSPSPRQLRCERLTQQIYVLEVALGRVAQIAPEADAQQAAS